MVVAIHQPNYIPWSGYFAKIAAADLFVVLDDVPLSNGRSFVSRVQLLGLHGPQWLTVPLVRGGALRIADARIAEPGFRSRHLRTLQAIYGHAVHAPALLALLLPHYAAAVERIADFNMGLLVSLLRFLGIATPMVRASELGVSASSGSEHLLALVRAVGGTTYLSGPSGVRYLDARIFREAGVALRVGRYEPIPYAQPGDRFVPSLSILDALFHIGSAATASLLRYDCQPVGD